jgi:hypothetical protein
MVKAANKVIIDQVGICESSLRLTLSLGKGHVPVTPLALSLNLYHRAVQLQPTMKASTIILALANMTLITANRPNLITTTMAKEKNIALAGDRESSLRLTVSHNNELLTFRFWACYYAFRLSAEDSKRLVFSSIAMSKIHFYKLQLSPRYDAEGIYAVLKTYF